MYYHCRDLKHVKYGKVYPAPVDSLDKDFLPAYQWLGQHCGFFPQIWLSRSVSRITGIRNSREHILFGFEHVQGFPVSYDHWEFLLNPLLNRPKPDDQYLAEYFTELSRDLLAEGEELDDILQQWQHSQGIDDFLQRYVFVERNQVVVPSLNLKSAKEIICRNEQQRKKLRRMGFIEDRVKIRNIGQR